jgi:hypothetical protein
MLTDFARKSKLDYVKKKLREADTAVYSAINAIQLLLKDNEAVSEDSERSITEKLLESKKTVTAALNVIRTALDTAVAKVQAEPSQVNPRIPVSAAVPASNTSRKYASGFEHPPKLGSDEAPIEAFPFDMWRYLIETKLHNDSELYPTDQAKGEYVFSRLANPRGLQEAALKWIRERNFSYTHTELLDFLRDLF